MQERETGPLYNFSEQGTYGEENHYDGTYCHLYKKSVILSTDLYGIQNSMSVSSPSTMEEESAWSVAYICKLIFSVKIVWIEL